MQTKRTLENTLRGAVKRFGVITTKTAGRGFAQRASLAMAQDPAYAGYARPLLEVLAGVVAQIRTYDRQLRAIAREHQVSRRLMTVPGVGHLTALAFLSTIEDPSRFKRSADVGPYLGLTPKVYQSGEIDRSGRITKTGDQSSVLFDYTAGLTIGGATVLTLAIAPRSSGSLPNIAALPEKSSPLVLVNELA